ncbi:MAG: hypothetical protein ACYC6P_04375 [Ignavibacteriaceae bacterium]
MKKGKRRPEGRKKTLCLRVSVVRILLPQRLAYRPRVLRNSFISSRTKIDVSKLSKKRFLAPVEMTFRSCATASAGRHKDTEEKFSGN